jgi:hypothetical protein
LAEERTIATLPQLVAGLGKEDRELFTRIFQVTSVTGQLFPPPEMHGWITERFGPVDRVKNQEIIKLTNLATLEGALFNRLRAVRPVEGGVAGPVREAIARAEENCQFCHAAQQTSADPFGRVRGRYCLTASNIAKSDGHHAVIIFDEHNPLAVSGEAIVDGFLTARRWAERVRAEDPAAKYFFFFWNCLWKSGASIIHGHAQATVAREMHYPKVEALRRAMVAYREKYRSGYFADLYKAHAMAGLAWEWGTVKGFAYLTPVKEKEVFLLAEEAGPELYEAAARVIMGYRAIACGSFNLALLLPPLAETGEDWEGFPAIIRTVDRGNPAVRTSDIGAVELYAASVVVSDPFQVAAVIREFGHCSV